jgi:hypothetical protein
MTATELPTDINRRRRVYQWMLDNPEHSESEAYAVIDAELAAEREEDRKNEERWAEGNDFLAAVWRCGCCGVGSCFGAADALCDDCRPLVASAKAERIGRKRIGSQTRAELAAHYIEKYPDR